MCCHLRAYNLAQFQLFSMFFEAHCGLVVMKDRLLRRRFQPAANGRPAETLLETLTPAEALRQCRPEAAKVNSAASAFLEGRKGSDEQPPKVPSRFREGGGGTGADEIGGKHAKWRAVAEPKVRTAGMVKARP